MKIDLKDLKKAIAWIEANTKAETINFYSLDGKLYLSTFDKYQADVQITIYEGSTMMPKITKTEVL